MRFIVSTVSLHPGVYLIPDRWNDWFVWVTQFTAFVVSSEGNRTSLGSVKIARRGMTQEDGATHLPPDFTALDETYFSLGQSENYYETLAELGDEFRTEYLRALRDCAFDTSVLDANRNEPVMRGSLLRDVPIERVRHRFNRLANGDAAPSRYTFEYEFASDPIAAVPAPKLTFDVRPNTLPPTNVHVLIGRNGVGKSRCFDLLSRALLRIRGDSDAPTGTLSFKPQTLPFITAADDTSQGFAGLVTVAFSAFDNSRPFTQEEVDNVGIRYAYIGLKKLAHKNEQPDQQAEPGEEVDPLKSHIELAREFVDSVERCLVGVRLRLWREALETLEADPLFEEADVSALASAGEKWKIAAYRLFRSLSSGHGIVLLTITRLVELVEERSLVLLDEPEGHLHPPLLSAFVRALSHLLIRRNGVAIIATHSPVVLQEVPRSCVWVLSRAGRSSRVDRPEVETFGENVGVLTREVFGLEVVRSGFHRMIADAARQLGDYERVLAHFGGNLGAEARGLARTLVLIPRDELEDEHDETDE